VTRGGSGAVAYTISEPSVRDGVAVGESFYRGYAHPDDPDRRIAIYAVPTDGPAKPTIQVVAEDAAGNVGHGRWSVVVKDRVLPEASVTLPESFLELTVRDLAEASGIDTADLQAAFARINSEMRRANEQQIRSATAATAARPLWQGAFEQLENSKVTSRFAEQRTYFVGGEKNSEAVHYGYDLASTSSAPIAAANAGRVVYADDLGIYGNCVLVDHGLGVATLYGHLSQIDVAAGDEVSKGERLGLSGATGLAGGDHLHFAILVGGTYVDPLEWWDRTWVRTHIDTRLDVSDQ
jgi:murein DD-endopeptidase MepM/ murein hydrolase activator NlpD